MSTSRSSWFSWKNIAAAADDFGSWVVTGSQAVSTSVSSGFKQIAKSSVVVTVSENIDNISKSSAGRAVQAAVTGVTFAGAVQTTATVLLPGGLPMKIAAGVVGTALGAKAASVVATHGSTDEQIRQLHATQAILIERIQKLEEKCSTSAKVLTQLNEEFKKSSNEQKQQIANLAEKYKEMESGTEETAAMTVANRMILEGLVDCAQSDVQKKYEPLLSTNKTGRALMKMMYPAGQPAQTTRENLPAENTTLPKQSDDEPQAQIEGLSNIDINYFGTAEGQEGIAPPSVLNMPKSRKSYNDYDLGDDVEGEEGLSTKVRGLLRR